MIPGRWIWGTLAIGIVSCGRAEPGAASASRLPRATGQQGLEEIGTGGITGRDSPNAGEDAAIAYDRARSRVLLYGGKNDDDVVLNELWAFELGLRRWTRVACEGPEPPALEDHTLVIDTAQDQLVLFGGENGNSSNGTWALDLGTNRWQDITRADAPRLESHVAIFDPRARRMVVSGGMCVQKDERELEKRTWVLDLHHGSLHYGAWSTLRTNGPAPGPRREHAGVYDAEHHRLLVFGGRQRSSDSFLDDLWALDLASDTWQEIETHGERPEPVRRTVLAYDSGREELTVFGGEVLTVHAGDEQQSIVNQIWVLELRSGEWTDRTPYPPGMYDHMGLFVPEYGATLIYGGSSFRSRKEHSTWLIRRQGLESPHDPEHAVR